MDYQIRKSSSGYIRDCDSCGYPTATTESPMYRDGRHVGEWFICEICHSHEGIIAREQYPAIARMAAWIGNRILDEIRKVRSEPPNDGK